MAPKDNHTTRRALLRAGGLLSLSGLAACASGSVVGDHAKLARTLLFGGGKAATLKREDVAKIPYASMSVRVGRQAEGLIVLSRIEGRDLVWISGDQIMLVTRGGRLIKTGGLDHNLVDTLFNQPDPVDGGLLAADGTKSMRILDYRGDLGQNIEARSTFKHVKRETIRILEAPIETIEVKEKVRIRKLEWGHTNRYWVDAKTGFVWRSRQHFHIDFAPLVLTILRPAKV